MKPTFKNDLCKTVVFIENILLLFLTTVSTVLFLCEISAGAAIFLCSCYVLYPLILITFVIGLACKWVVIRDYKLNIGLFIANLPVSFLCLLGVLYKFASALESF